MTQWAIRLPIAAIMGASGLGATLFAEATPPDYATPGVIIAVLFSFIGTCALVLYKVVLAPLFAVFIASLQNAEKERTEFLKSVIEMNKLYGENLTTQNAINARQEKLLIQIVRNLKGKTDGATVIISDEASV